MHALPCRGPAQLVLRWHSEATASGEMPVVGGVPRGWPACGAACGHGETPTSLMRRLEPARCVRTCDCIHGTCVHCCLIQGTGPTHVFAMVSLSIRSALLEKRRQGRPEAQDGTDTTRGHRESPDRREHVGMQVRRPNARASTQRKTQRQVHALRVGARRASLKQAREREGPAMLPQCYSDV